MNTPLLPRRSFLFRLLGLAALPVAAKALTPQPATITPVQFAAFDRKVGEWLRPSGVLLQQVFTKLHVSIRQLSPMHYSERLREVCFCGTERDGQVTRTRWRQLERYDRAAARWVIESPCYTVQSFLPIHGCLPRVNLPLIQSYRTPYVHHGVLDDSWGKDVAAVVHWVKPATDTLA